MAADEPPEGTVSPELEASREAERKVVDKNLDCVQVAGKMFVLYKNLISENAWSKWSTIVAQQIRAKPWTDLTGKVHTAPQSPSVQSVDALKEETN
jgi:hypothetical protein